MCPLEMNDAVCSRLSGLRARRMSGKALEEQRQADSGFQPGKRGTQAQVSAVTERDVVVSAASGVEFPGGLAVPGRVAVRGSQVTLPAWSFASWSEG